MFAYAWLYKAILREPLFGALTSQAPITKNLSILIVFSPVWIFGAMAVGYYLRSRATNESTKG
jgi:hypothetical protein